MAGGLYHFILKEKRGDGMERKEGSGRWGLPSQCPYLAASYDMKEEETKSWLDPQLSPSPLMVFQLMIYYPVDTFIIKKPESHFSL